MDSFRISEFIKQYIPERDDRLQKLRAESEKTGVPVIREETEAFLRAVIALLRPHRILELGTAVGYSAISMLCTADDGATIDTIEDWEPRLSEAQANIKEVRLEDRIQLIAGDAFQVMKSMEEPYDLIFIDAAKGQYPDYLDEAIRLTHEGSVIIADNIFQDGEVMESKYIVERRNRTIHKRMREFLDNVSGDDRLVTSILPVGDGIIFSVRIR